MTYTNYNTISNSHILESTQVFISTIRDSVHIGKYSSTWKWRDHNYHKQHGGISQKNEKIKECRYKSHYWIKIGKTDIWHSNEKSRTLRENFMPREYWGVSVVPITSYFLIELLLHVLIQFTKKSFFCLVVVGFFSMYLIVQLKNW